MLQSLHPTPVTQKAEQKGDSEVTEGGEDSCRITWRWLSDQQEWVQMDFARRIKWVLGEQWTRPEKALTYNCIISRDGVKEEEAMEPWLVRQ